MIEIIFKINNIETFRIIKKSILIFFTAMLLTGFPSSVSAKVTGVCSTCHTMHNSQNGAAVAAGPNDQLLNDGCVGCHSATDGVTWKDSVTGAPIVWNQAEPSFNTQKGLAGGNFYWVGAGDDTKGHNVWGISDPDSNLSMAAGSDSCGEVNGCHVTLASNPAVRNQALFDGKGGCQGCHIFTYHHMQDDATSSNTGYRFLWGHSWSPQDGYTARVEGVEDNDWEQETAIDHNWYKGTTDTYQFGGALKNKRTITAFCSGCHFDFHGPESFGDGMGSSSPWLRHPTDIALPTTGEYAGYQGYASYNADVPVAFTNPLAPSDSTAIVMCLSCHRAHGSEQPDMLRFDYTGMIVGGGGSGGCFVCHTTKDGS